MYFVRSTKENDELLWWNACSRSSWVCTELMSRDSRERRWRHSTHWRLPDHSILTAWVEMSLVMWYSVLPWRHIAFVKTIILIKTLVRVDAICQVGHHWTIYDQTKESSVFLRVAIEKTIENPQLPWSLFRSWGAQPTWMISLAVTAHNIICIIISHGPIYWYISN